MTQPHCLLHERLCKSIHPNSIGFTKVPVLAKYHMTCRAVLTTLPTRSNSCDSPGDSCAIALLSPFASGWSPWHHPTPLSKRRVVQGPDTVGLRFFVMDFAVLRISPCYARALHVTTGLSNIRDPIRRKGSE